MLLAFTRSTTRLRPVVRTAMLIFGTVSTRNVSVSSIATIQPSHHSASRMTGPLWQLLAHNLTSLNRKIRSRKTLFILDMLQIKKPNLNKFCCKLRLHFAHILYNTSGNLNFPQKTVRMFQTLRIFSLKKEKVYIFIFISRKFSIFLFSKKSDWLFFHSNILDTLFLMLVK